MIDSYVLTEKSRHMKNLFSSPRISMDLQKFIIKQLDYLLNEQRKQRADLATLLRISTKIINATQLQKQVDDFYPTPLEDMAQDGDTDSNPDSS